MQVRSERKSVYICLTSVTKKATHEFIASKAVLLRRLHNISQSLLSRQIPLKYTLQPLCLHHDVPTALNITCLMVHDTIFKLVVGIMENFFFIASETLNKVSLTKSLGSCQPDVKNNVKNFIVRRYEHAFRILIFSASKKYNLKF